MAGHEEPGMARALREWPQRACRVYPDTSPIRSIAEHNFGILEHDISGK